MTGHTGFKGAWLTTWLKQLGANIVGISLDPSTDPSHYVAAQISNGITDLRIDIRDFKTLENAIVSTNPDYVFHLAAQSLVGHAYEDPLGTWRTNLLGTIHVLEALRNLDKPCSAVIITSDKCYDNVEWVWGYRETDALGGADPYSASKGASELAIKSYAKSYFSEGSCIRIASARAGNVIGGGDWSPNRIIPDCVKAWALNRHVNLRNPHSTRPWQHVLEPLSGYLTLAISLSQQPKLHGESFNFGPQTLVNHSVIQLVEEMAFHWDKVCWEDVSSRNNGPYESGLLKLNCDKALHYLNWHAAMDFRSTVRMTTQWYKAYYQNPKTISSITKEQIATYSAIAKNAGLTWAQ